MAKYIDLPNLKENLTNFLNKKINPIYAKKTEIPSNVSELNNDKSYQTAEEVGQAVTDGVARIVAGAPEDFDTLKEMSDWISSHETSAAAMNSAISDNSVAIANHTSNSNIHVTKEEKTKWNKLDSNLKDGTIIVAEATKATQDAQGNVINETYAKKTEVPQGTVVDDALSSTSTNPVQNKVVKAEFDQVNSNLSNLKYGEVAGGKNLLQNGDDLLKASDTTKNDDGTYTCTLLSLSTQGQFFKLPYKKNTQYVVSMNISSTTNNAIFFIWVYDDGLKSPSRTDINSSTKRVAGRSEIGRTCVGLEISYAYPTGTVTISDIQIEEGTTATPYEPYISSVKMLAEENAQQSAALKNLPQKIQMKGAEWTGTLESLGNNVYVCINGGNATDKPSGASLYGYYMSTYLNGGANYCEYLDFANKKMYSKMWIGAVNNGTGWIELTADVAKLNSDLNTKANIADPVFTGSFSQNRKAGSTIGESSHAEGNGTTASGIYSHAEGSGATAEGRASHAEGDGYAIGYNSHAEGNYSSAEGDKSHAEGTRSWGLGDSSHAEGYQTTASGSSSHSEGSSTNRVSDITTSFSKEISISDIITLRKSNKFSLAHGYGSHVEGTNSLALGRSSHAEGENTIASGDYSHAEGNGTIASGDYSHAEGCDAYATSDSSHAEGNGASATGDFSHAEGNWTTASGVSSHAEGDNTIASNYSSHAAGKLNAPMTTGGTFDNTTGTAFVIGNGTSEEALSNAFSVQYDGTVKAKSTITASTTADYAEFFEWLDENPNNEDRVGYFVTLDGDRIKIATSEDDYILGIVSGEPFVLGNGDCDTWNGMYLHDEFRRTIYEPAPKVEKVEIKEEREETYIDEETGEEKTRTVEVVVGHEFKEVEGEFDGTRPKLNPEYDNTQQYISRFDRKEWSPVGMLGVLAVRHDGTAKVNGYVTVNKNGIATACDKKADNSYRVIKANTDSVVEIVFR